MFLSTNSIMASIAPSDSIRHETPSECHHYLYSVFIFILIPIPGSFLLFATPARASLVSQSMTVTFPLVDVWPGESYWPSIDTWRPLSCIALWLMVSHFFQLLLPHSLLAPSISPAIRQTLSLSQYSRFRELFSAFADRTVFPARELVQNRTASETYALFRVFLSTCLRAEEFPLWMPQWEWSDWPSTLDFFRFPLSPGFPISH